MMEIFPLLVFFADVLVSIVKKRLIMFPLDLVLILPAVSPFWNIAVNDAICSLGNTLEDFKPDVHLDRNCLQAVGDFFFFGSSCINMNAIGSLSELKNRRTS